MCNSAQNRVNSAGFSGNCDIIHGDVTAMKHFDDGSVSAILSFNVLAYLTNSEEEIFYSEATRLISEYGFLSVTHSNVLFDLFTLNSKTCEFFLANFNCDISSLLNSSQKGPSVTYNIRENPLSYSQKLLKYGFVEQYQAFINFHSAPPLLTNTHGGGGGAQQIKGVEKAYPSTLDVSAEDTWKLLFRCSTFGSLSSKIK